MDRSPSVRWGLAPTATSLIIMHSGWTNTLLRGHASPSVRWGFTPTANARKYVMQGIEQSPSVRRGLAPAANARMYDMQRID